ncbi:MAG: MotA/TolQ/ExbB proton channel family protein [Candidatus Omnitrophica bacterium]|nr:MotA/TolQ/ExbB proton channel family protein [Candidatus Omnitrophota bacterium]MDD5352644.1 MotA/TolQ/ExbB proton channel family protein [Candidatus Omnitrophota bacterium]MDD5550243.1 MotA/TolQ/ExbB proton channel family protein [Candidatus Omnitrophota bacterium]
MIPIILCSIFGFAIAIEKKWQLHKVKIGTDKFLNDIMTTIRKFKIKEAVEICDSSRSPIARILKAGIVKYDKSKEEIRQAMEDASLYEIPKLEKNLIALATVAHISPLLGLLGTVTGLVRCFQVIQAKASSFAPVNPGDLAGGIWEALITTVAGLIVAIPIFVIYNYLASSINSFILDMERNATELVNFLSEGKKDK